MILAGRARVLFRAGVAGGLLMLVCTAGGVAVPVAAVAEPVPSVAVVTSSAAMTPTTFTATGATATCPSGTTLVGGGDTLTVTAGGSPVPNNGAVTLGVAPVTGVGQPVASGTADPTSWTATGGYSALAPGGDTVTAYAMCASGVTSSTVAEVAVSTSSDPVGPVTATCPGGTSLVGGGGGYTSFVGGSNNTKLLESFPSDASGDLLPNDPTAWTVEGNSNNNAGAPTTAVALCATDVTLATEVVTSSYGSSDVSAGGTISATVGCPSDSILLDGGLEVDDNPSGPGTGGQGVHVISDDPGGSSGSWTVTAEDGGQTLTSLVSTAVALCVQTQFTTTTTTPTTTAPTTTVPGSSTSTTLAPGSGVGTSPATGTTTSVPDSSTATTSGVSSPPSTPGSAIVAPTTVPRTSRTIAGRTAAAATPSDSTPSPTNPRTATPGGVAPPSSNAKGSGVPGPDTVTGLVVDSSGTVPRVASGVAPRASTVPRTLLAATGGGLGEGFWIVLVAVACLVIGMFGERSRSRRTRTLRSLPELRPRRERSRPDGH